MTINRRKASSYNELNTGAICRYITEYTEEITALIQNKAQLGTVNRAVLKQCAADLETVQKRLAYAINGID